MLYSTTARLSLEASRSPSGPSLNHSDMLASEEAESRIVELVSKVLPARVHCHYKRTSMRFIGLLELS